MKLDLDASNVQELELSRDEVRAYFDGKYDIDALDNILDKAQGDVANASPQYVVIKIS